MFENIFAINVQSRIKTSANLKERVEGKGYTATTDDPYFEVSGFFVGWFMFEVRMDMSTALSHLRIYYDDGTGFFEENSYGMNVTTGKLHKRIIWFPKKSRIRLDPVDVECEFNFSRVRLVHLTGFRAKQLIRKKLGQPKGFLGIVRDSDFFAYNNYIEARSKNIDYTSWIQFCEKEQVLSRIKDCKVVDDNVKSPSFSVVVPVYKPDLVFFKKCVESILGQEYEDIELCLVDDCSGSDELTSYIAEVASKDSRVKYKIRDENGHISRATNDAISMAVNDFLVFVDHDDVLPNYSLKIFSDEILKRPRVDVLYSDEDKIDTMGGRYDPHFKPDFDRERILTQNYMSHLSVIRRSLVLSVGALRVGYEGSQDHDLVLRALSYLNWNKEKVCHIPLILYHWRAVEGSTALSSGEKNYTEVAGLLAVKDVLKNDNTVSDVIHGGLPNTYRVVRSLPQNSELVSIIMPTRDCKEVVECAIESILGKTIYDNYEIILIDNGSSDPVAIEYFKEIEQRYGVRVIKYPYEFNYSAINNFAVKQARGDLLVFLNNDVEIISENWLSEMVSNVIRPEIGCVGAKLLYGNGLVQHGGVILGINGLAGHAFKMESESSPGYFGQLLITRQVSCVTAACMAVRKRVFEQVGGFEEDNLKVAFNDVDLCLKVLSAGYVNLWTPHALLYHHESLSRGAEDTPEKVRRFNSEVEYMKGRWAGMLHYDSFYNVNLSLDGELETFQLTSNAKPFCDEECV